MVIPESIAKETYRAPLWGVVVCENNDEVESPYRDG